MTISLGNFINDIASNSTAFFSSMSPVFTLVLGIALAMWVIGFIVDRLSGDPENDNIS